MSWRRWRRCRSRPRVVPTAADVAREDPPLSVTDDLVSVMISSRRDPPDGRPRRVRIRPRVDQEPLAPHVGVVGSMSRRPSHVPSQRTTSGGATLGLGDVVDPVDLVAEPIGLLLEDAEEAHEERVLGEVLGQTLERNRRLIGPPPGAGTTGTAIRARVGGSPARAPSRRSLRTSASKNSTSSTRSTPSTAAMSWKTSLRQQVGVELPPGAVAAATDRIDEPVQDVERRGSGRPRLVGRGARRTAR